MRGVQTDECLPPRIDCKEKLARKQPRAILQVRPNDAAELVEALDRRHRIAGGHEPRVVAPDLRLAPQCLMPSAASRADVVGVHQNKLSCVPHRRLKLVPSSGSTTSHAGASCLSR